jgi:RNA polymerase sigma-70 factor (ECF subfamily)
MTRKEYNECVDQHADSIFRFVLKNLKDEEQAKDVVQDVFLKLWVNVQKVDNQKVKSYLFTAAYHQTIDVVRKQKPSIDFSEQTSVYTEERYDLIDVQEILKKAVDLLPVDQRSVILLRDFEGYSYQEIAEITKFTDAQVKVYIFRARKFMKQYLTKIELGVY